MPKYIELEEVMEILKNWEGITYNCDTIEESFDMLADAVEILPTIDPIAEIDKLIQDDMFISESKEYPLLQELKRRLSLIK